MQFIPDLDTLDIRVLRKLYELHEDENFMDFIMRDTREGIIESIRKTKEKQDIFKAIGALDFLEELLEALERAETQIRITTERR